MNLLDWLKSKFNKPQRPQNTGVVEAPLRETDYVVGASPISYKERLSDGNWLPFVWSEVKQWCIKNGIYQDNLGCTGNALATALETQLFFRTGVKRKISRRWINKMSGCNQGKYKGIGNLIIAPVDWVRKNGFVWEEDYPTPDTWTVDEYYAPIPSTLNATLLAKAKENWLKYRVPDTDDCLQYEYLQITDPNLDKHLKHAPILAHVPGHQTCAIYSPTQITIIRDSYEPWNKQFNTTDFLTLLKVIIEPPTIESGFGIFNDGPEVWFFAKLDTMDTKAKLEQDFQKYFPKYDVNPQIRQLPFKKPF